MQWRSDLIGYDALTSYGSPSYYAQKMFSTTTATTCSRPRRKTFPTYTWQPPTRITQRRPVQARARASCRRCISTPRATAQSGTIYLKVVNRLATPQPVKIEISGVASVEAKGEAIVMKASSPDDTNSIKRRGKSFPSRKKLRPGQPNSRANSRRIPSRFWNCKAK
jgi:alpha-N-arabinofuranosidase